MDVYVVLVDESDDTNVVDDTSNRDVVCLVLRAVDDGIEVLDDHEEVG